MIDIHLLGGVQPVQPVLPVAAGLHFINLIPAPAMVGWLAGCNCCYMSGDFLPKFEQFHSKYGSLGTSPVTECRREREGSTFTNIKKERNQLHTVRAGNFINF